MAGNGVGVGQCYLLLYKSHDFIFLFFTETSCKWGKEYEAGLLYECDGTGETEYKLEHGDGNG